MHRKIGSFLSIPTSLPASFAAALSGPETGFRECKYTHVFDKNKTSDDFQGADAENFLKNRAARPDADAFFRKIR